jgi:uncharacterized membrane protein YdjX (TVP38/TMEM64 family)
MRYKKILLLAILAAVFATSYFAGLWDYLTFEYYKANRDAFVTAVKENYILSSIIFISVYIGVTALSIPGATIMTLTGGYIFGYIGVIHVNIGATAGATAAFAAARYIAGESLQRKYADKLERLNRELEVNGRNYLLMLRFIFVFPFFLLNLLAGLTKIPLTTFVWTTSLGILPGSMAYIYAGKQIQNIDSPSDIFTLNMMLAFIFLGVVALLPVLIQKFYRKKQKG